MIKLHIANLSDRVSETQLNEHFGRYGEVLKIEVVWARSLGRIVGSAVIEMPFGEGIAAARELNGKPFRGRSLYITIMSNGIAASGKL